MEVPEVSEPNWPDDVERLLAALIDLPSAERSVRIMRLCAHNLELQAEVEALLAAHESADCFLQTGKILGTGILRLAIDEEGGRIGGDPHLSTDAEIRSALPARIGRYRIVRNRGRRHGMCV